MPRPDGLVLGIDEAGRGPIVGPMVMAAVALAPARSARLTRLGVQDSKRFGAGEEAHAARSELVCAILDAADHAEVLVIETAEIDRRTRLGELNRLEQEHAARLIERAPPSRRIVADGEKLFRPLCRRFPHLEPRDHGESAHVAVAAASILAKVRRDEAFQAIAARYAAEFGDGGVLRGGGYMNDPTRAFLRAYIARHGAIPPEARRSWPWDFARDLLPPHFDPWAGVPDERPQLSLFR